MAIPRRWMWGAGGVALVGVLLLSTDPEQGEQGEQREQRPGCEVEVTADVLNVRSGSGTGFPVIDRLSAGDTVEATRTAENGFRRLSGGRWAADRFLVATDGSDCG